MEENAKRPLSRPALSYPRKRATKACEICRVRKVKCDNVRPVCGSCSRSGLQCIYGSDENDYSVYDPASVAILNKLDLVLGKVEGTIDDQRNGSRANSRESLESIDKQVCDTWASTVEHVFAWPPFQIKFAPRPVPITSLLVETEYDRDPGTAYVDLRAEPLSSAETAQLVEDYIANVYTKNPILSTTRLRSLAQNYAEDLIVSNLDFCFLMLACALGAVSSRFDEDNPYGRPQEYATSLDQKNFKEPLANRYFRRAQANSYSLNPFAMETVQFKVLSGIYYMYTLKPLKAWAQFHSASEVFLYIKRFNEVRGFDQEATSPELLRLEQGLYWTCLKCECEITATVALPMSSITALDYPYALPTPPPEVVGLIDSANPSEYDQQAVDNWYYYLTDISLRKIENRVLNEFYRPENGTACPNAVWSRLSLEDLYTSAQEYLEEIDQVRSKLSPHIQAEMIKPATKSEVLFFSFRRFESVVCYITRPVVYQIVMRPDEAGSRFDPIISRFLKAVVREPMHGFYRHHGTWLMTREITANSLVLYALIAATGDRYISREAALDHTAMVGRYLSYWKDESATVQETFDIVQIVARHVLGVEMSLL